MVFEACLEGDKTDRSLQRQAMMVSRLSSIVKNLGVEAENELLLSLISNYVEKNNQDLKTLMKILIELYTVDGQPPAQPFVDLSIKVAKAMKCSNILSPFLLRLPYETVKEHMPLMIL